MQSRQPQGIPLSAVEWDHHGSPVSTRYREAYFSSSDPPAERRHVFLEGNLLPDAWQGRREFTIGELGFGFGLSFLLAWKLWAETAAPGSRLHFISFERQAITAEDMRLCHSRWPELTELSEELLAALPNPVFGAHQLLLSRNVELILAYGDALENLPRLAFSADCWFLDGFSPAKNPEMWNAGLASLVTSRSAPGATFATFSAARVVRDSFAAAGWNIAKRHGAPPKRDMLSGNLQPPVHLPVPLPARRSAKNHPAAIVIGGGIAGSAVAESLSRRGIAVRLIDKAGGLAAGASGNPGGILMPHVSLDPDPISRLAIKGYLHALRTIARFEEEYSEIPHARCGVLRLASSPRLETLFQRIDETGLRAAGLIRAVSSEETKDCCGIACAFPGIFFSSGAWIDPRGFTSAPLSGNRCVELELNQEAKVIRRDGESWRVFNSRGDLLGETELLIISNSFAASEFGPCAWFPLEPVRGQLISHPADSVSGRIASVICFDGYILPAVNGQHVIGATYDHGDTSASINQEQSEDLLRRVKDAVPSLNFAAADTAAARVSFRAMTRDRLPIVGRVPTLDSYSGVDCWREEFQPEYHPGLHVSVGHGSRGLITAHLSAEILVSEIFNEPAIIESDLREHLEAERYLTRLMKRGVKINEQSAASWKVSYPAPG